MPRRNGLAAVPPARVLPVERKPFRVTPKTITYTFESDDGETISLAGYLKAGCPLDVAIAYDEALAESEAIQPNADDRASLSPAAYYARAMRFARLQRRDLLAAVIPGLVQNNDFRMANLLAADDGPAEEILIELGWWTRVDPAEGDDDGPEAAAGDASPGAGASPASSLATASTPSDASTAQA